MGQQKKYQYTCMGCKATWYYDTYSGNYDICANCDEMGAFMGRIIQQIKEEDDDATKLNIRINFMLHKRKGNLAGYFRGYDEDSDTVFIEMSGKFKGDKLEVFTDNVVLHSYQIGAKVKTISPKENKQDATWKKLQKLTAFSVQNSRNYQKMEDLGKPSLSFYRRNICRI